MDKKDRLKEARQFGITLAFILSVLAGFQYLKHRVNVYPVLSGISLAVLCTAIIKPRLLLPVFIVFTRVGHAIGWFNTRLILVVIYACFVTPIALIRKMIGKDPLPKRIDKQAKSYWVSREEKQARKEKLETQF